MKYTLPVFLLLSLLALGACKSKRELAREELAAKNLSVTADDFLRAARAGDLEDLAVFLRAGLDANTADAAGDTAFAAAVAAGQFAAAEFLSLNGADIERPNNAGQSPLLAAVVEGRAPAARFLLAAGAAPDAAMFAVADNREIINELLLAGAVPDEGGIMGQPPLVWAVAAREPEPARRLLAAGASPNIAVNGPVGDAFVALVNDDKLTYYLKKERGVTPLMIAAGLGDLTMVQLLIEHGAKRTAATTGSKTRAVYIAAVNRHTPVVQYLLGVNPAPEAQIFTVEISLSRQRAVLYQSGTAIFRSPVSTGSKGFETPKGNFVVTNKHEEWFSTLYDEAPMPFFLRLNFGAVGLHAGALPGYPASHGCIRLPPGRAKELFGKVAIGTRVNIVD